LSVTHKKGNEIVTLILSIFPGIGLLDRAFEAEGFCVVRGPDVLWGGDIRSFHPPENVFDGIIGGDPCQSHSGLANLLRAKGQETQFGDLSSEFVRVVEAARPTWFLRENTDKAPNIQPECYSVSSFLLDNAALQDGETGAEQVRKRRFWFGLRCHHCEDEMGREDTRDVSSEHVPAIDLRKYIKFALLKHPEPKHSVTGRHTSNGMGPAKPGNPPKYSIEEACELQGLPKDFMEYAPFTVEGKRKVIGNGVPIPMGRALAKAIQVSGACE
jgi:DNA (cytosine-5)-methyltransferase 1